MNSGDSDQKHRNWAIHTVGRGRVSQVAGGHLFRFWVNGAFGKTGHWVVPRLITFRPCSSSRTNRPKRSV
jgi:hypothetical protein